ncbi:hypothetical protein KI688_005379 [Linnemannia hyalina]|uniref:Uncharacterized protein n=1 Tax=Linnemannia hyalina TaxID=64524 RepID=A0A9P7XKW6_9FUNG|nr:hypothetical protein KI688_005379 [Linnemannia hyalina]
MLQRTGSGSAPSGDTAIPPSAVISASVPLPTASSSSAGGLPPPSLSPSQTPSPPLPSAIQLPQILSPSPRPTKIKTFSISYQLPLPSGHPQKSLVSSSPVSPIPAKDISLSMITDYPYPSYTRKACEECFGLGYVQRICQECLRDRHRQQSRRRMKHTSLPNAWNQFGTKIKEQLFSHSSTTMAAAVSSNATTVLETPAAATTATIATTTGTNGNASSTSPPFSSSMFFPLQRRNTSANARTGEITLPTATTAKSGIAGLSLKNKWQSQQRSKSMVSLPLTTNPPSLSGHSSSPTTPTAVVPTSSSSSVPSTALTGTASLSSASNAMIAMTGTTTIITAGSGAGMGLRPVGDSECEGTESTDWRNLNSSSDTTSEEGDNDDADVDGREGKGKKVIGNGESTINNSNNNNSQLIPTTTVRKSFKATVMGALKLPNLNLFQGHLRSTTTSTTTLSNNTNNNNDNSRSRRMVKGAGISGSMNHSDRVSGGFNSFSKLAPTRDRQTAIDGYFEPINEKTDVEQRLQSEMSGYIPSSNQDMTDATAMQSDAPLYHAVPASPAPFSNSDEDSLWSYEERKLHDDDFYQDFGGAQTVPVLNTKLKNATCSNSVRSGKKIGVTFCKDPSKVFSGSIRMQSILFARNIAQLASTTELTGKRSSDHAATWDEIEHTLKGAYRGLCPKQA